MLDHITSLFFIFSETFLLFSIVGIPIYVLTNNVGEFPFLHIRDFIFKQHFSCKTFSFDLKIHHEKKVTSFTSRFVPLSSTPDSPPDTSLSWLPVPHSITCWCILPLGLLFHPAISLPCFHFGSRDVRPSVSIQLTFLTPPHTACSLDWMQRLVRQGLCPQKSPAWRRIWTRKEANSMSCGEGTG